MSLLMQKARLRFKIVVLGASCEAKSKQFLREYIQYYLPGLFYPLHQEQYKEAVHFFTRAQAYSQAIRICKVSDFLAFLNDHALLCTTREVKYNSQLIPWYGINLQTDHWNRSLPFMDVRFGLVCAMDEKSLFVGFSCIGQSLVFSKQSTIFWFCKPSQFSLCFAWWNKLPFLFLPKAKGINAIVMSCVCV